MTISTKKEKDSFEEAWDQMTSAFKKRKAELFEREQTLEQTMTNFETQHPNMGEPNDVLTLNVSGTKMYVTLSLIHI